MSRKIKIIYLIDTFKLAGAEKLLLEFCRRIDRQKFSIQVIATTMGGPLEADFLKLGIPVKIFQKKSKFDLGLILALAKYFKANQPDIVHAHLFASETWGRLGAIIAKVPKIVITEHNMNIDFSFSMHLIKTVLSWFTDKIIAVSEAVKNYSIKKEKINPKKITVIYNGIDLNKYQYRGLRQITKNKIKAVLLARMEKQKGQEYLLKAIPHIIKMIPGFELYLYGKGSLEKDYKNLADKLKISNQVKFCGITKNAAQVLNQMDLFILPSLWEGLGVVLLEAQAIGLPIIATDIPGPQEVIENEKTGILIPPKDSLAIADAVLRLANDPQMQENIIAKARKNVEENFSLSKMVADYTKLYESLTNK